MALIVTVSAPFTYLVARIIAVRTGRYFRAQANVLGRLNGYGEEMLSGFRTLKAYGYEEEAVRQFEQYDAQLYDAGVKAQFYGSLANPSTRFVMNTAYAAVGGAGALLALAGQITIGSISSFLMYSNLFSKPFTEISGVMTQLQSAVSSAQRVFDLLDEPQEDADGEQVLQVREGRVDFLHVFGYEPGQPLMKDITLHVPAGSRVAIVGRTGAGRRRWSTCSCAFMRSRGQPDPLSMIRISAAVPVIPCAVNSAWCCKILVCSRARSRRTSHSANQKPAAARSKKRHGEAARMNSSGGWTRAMNR